MPIRFVIKADPAGSGKLEVLEAIHPHSTYSPLAANFFPSHGAQARTDDLVQQLERGIVTNVALSAIVSQVQSEPEIFRLVGTWKICERLPEDRADLNRKHRI